MLNTTQNTASTTRFKQEFFHVGHRTTAHNLSGGSRYNKENGIKDIFLSSISNGL